MKIIADDLTEEQRIDIYLADILQNYSRSKIQSEIKSNSILVNSKSVKPSYIVKSSDVIEINIIENSYKIEPEKIIILSI